jgi:hypothetical protein
MSINFDQRYIDFSLARDYPPAPPEEQPEDQAMMEDVQLAAGPSGTVSDAGAAFGIYPGMGKRKQRSDIGERVITGAPDFAAGVARGATTSALGFGGDIQKIGRFISALATDNQGGNITDRLGRAALTMGNPTFLPSSEDVSKGGYTIPGTSITLPGLPAAVPAGQGGFGMTPEQRQGAAEFGQATGELVGDPLMFAKTGQLAAKAIQATKGMPVGMSTQAVGGMANVLTPPGPGVVSTRLPTAVKATEDPLANKLVIDLEASKRDPEAFAHNVGLVKQYPNFVSKARTPDKQADDFISQVKDNLLYLHDQVPDATRQRSKLWYDGARNIADRFSNDYGVPDQAVSGVLAVLSPQKDWFMNVSLGQRVLDIATKQRTARWDGSMDEMAKIIWSKPQYAPMVEAIRGKTLAELDDPGLKAMWLRTYDQAKNPREHQIVSPEGDFVGIRMNQDGKTPTKTGWGSLNEIGKAIVILDDPRIETISSNLGQQHKVRNFYNNIYAPTDPAGHVTIDTHAVAAGLLRPLSGNSREVLHNFGSGVVGEGGPKNSSITGVQGTYGLYAEAYRRAAQERGILPREMQSITWEAVRGLFPDTFKSQAKNVEQVDNIWLQYRKGKLSLDEARNEVIRTAGGINAPEWERAGLRLEPAQGIQPSGNTGELPGAGVPGGGAGGSGGVQPAGSNSSSVKRGRSAPEQGAK